MATQRRIVEGRGVGQQECDAQGSAPAAPVHPDPETAEATERLPLRTPAQAAQLLAVAESWLRRKAAARAIPCTFLGKHLRFSPADLAAISTGGAQPTNPATAPRRSARRPRRPR